MRNINTKFTILSAFLALIALASCDKVEPQPEPVQENNLISFSASLAPKDAATKALSTELDEAGKENLHSTWATGEEIALYYQIDESTYASAVAKITSVTSDGGAKIEAAIEESLDGGSVKLVYPASMHNGEGGINEQLLLSQHGDLSDDFDIAVGEGQLKIEGGNASLDGKVSMVNSLCVGKFVFKDGAAPLDDIKSLSISDGTRTYSIAPEGGNLLMSSEGIYVFLLPVEGATYTFTATVGEESYSSVRKAALAAGKFYRSLSIPLFQGHIVDLSTLTGYTYTLSDGDVLMGTGNKIELNVPEDATITLAGISTNRAIVCKGDATVVIAEGTNNTINMGSPNSSHAAIEAGPTGTTLEVCGDGNLEIKNGSYGGAGIGGKAGDSRTTPECGDILISGGNITVSVNSQYANSGSAIGSGRQGNCGNITITGGNLNLSSASSSAVIGAGFKGNCGDINITGGTIVAEAQSHGVPGIGSAGSSGAKEGSVCGDINITGGDLTVKGGYLSPGIGAGNYGTCADIKVDNCNLTVSGGSAGAGIGTGQQGLCGDIVISGIDINATGVGGGAGIGTGCGGNCGNITICGGSVKAQGGNQAAGIGSGQQTGTAGKYESITVTDGIVRVEATMGRKDTYNAAEAPIGRGYCTSNNTLLYGHVTIDGVLISDEEGKTKDVTVEDTPNLTWTLIPDENSKGMDSWILTKK